MSTSAASTPERMRSWFAGRPPWMVDLAVTAAVLVTGLVSTTAARGGDVDYRPRDATAFALILLATLPFLGRSRAPVAVFVVSAVAVITLSALGYSEGVLPAWLWVAAGTVGSRRTLRDVVGCAAFVMIALVALLMSDRSGLDLGGYLTQVAMFSTAFAVGYSMQARRAKVTALEERSRALEAEQAEAAGRAVADERLRIAQELHDVVAHSMSVIAVQAGSGAHVIDQDPAAAKRALESIADTSRTSLTELRALLGVLRSGEGQRAYAPTPGLGDLDRLVGEVRSAGVHVDLAVEGDVADVAPGVGLAAYRIVQEALTNVIKHAGPARATVRVSRTPGAVHVEVADDGRGTAVAPGGSSGHGLMGMRERVAIYGGTVDAGPAPTGGFRVVAHLPSGEGPT